MLIVLMTAALGVAPTGYSTVCRAEFGPTEILVFALTPKFGCVSETRSTY